MSFGSDSLSRMTSMANSLSPGGSSSTEAYLLGPEKNPNMENSEPVTSKDP
ncbi:Hypothetical protein FKW44_021937 [Caligus rogercresseyi]|uniref:Uncharacterized protein n=1 Tax=Caligus rogercresseyi TaxID=217165 RepID=A0A7T8JWI1_CALRO|nr:Hypothetical protein FKW44_021937 [Caligus rogercresseyi]